MNPQSLNIVLVVHQVLLQQISKPADVACQIPRVLRNEYNQRHRLIPEHPVLFQLIWCKKTLQGLCSNLPV